MPVIYVLNSRFAIIGNNVEYMTPRGATKLCKPTCICKPTPFHMHDDRLMFFPIYSILYMAVSQGVSANFDNIWNVCWIYLYCKQNIYSDMMGTAKRQMWYRSSHQHDNLDNVLIHINHENHQHHHQLLSLDCLFGAVGRFVHVDCVCNHTRLKFSVSSVHLLRLVYGVLCNMSLCLVFAPKLKNLVPKFYAVVEASRLKMLLIGW